MISDTITKLEEELSLVKQINERDESTLKNSVDPAADEIFFLSSEKLKSEIEKKLFNAKSERAHELLNLRLIGAQMTGSIRLRSLLKIIEPLNHLLEHSAWRIWDKEGHIDKLDDKFRNLLDLRLSGIETGSTELQIVGNTSPDLAGTSALEDGLRNVFELISSDNDTISEKIHDIGISSCKALSELMDSLEKQNIAVELSWTGPEKVFSWNGSPPEITRIRSILDDLGEPIKEPMVIVGIVHVLSVRNKIEIYQPDSKQKIIANYHRTLNDEIRKLHLGETLEFTLEKTTYPFTIAKTKKDGYTLKAVAYPKEGTANSL